MSKTKLTFTSVRKLEFPVYTPLLKTAWHVEFSPDGKYLAAGSDNSDVFLWETATWQLQAVLSSAKNTPNVKSVCFSPDNKYLLSASDDSNGILIWDIGTKQLCGVLEFPTSGTVERRSLMFSPSGQDVMVNVEKNIHIYDFNQRKLKWSSKSLAGGAFTPMNYVICCPEKDKIVIFGKDERDILSVSTTSLNGTIKPMVERSIYIMCTEHSIDVFKMSEWPNDPIVFKHNLLCADNHYIPVTLRKYIVGCNRFGHYLYTWNGDKLVLCGNLQRSSIFGAADVSHCGKFIVTENLEIWEIKEEAEDDSRPSVTTNKIEPRPSVETKVESKESTGTDNKKKALQTLISTLESTVQSYRDPELTEPINTQIVRYKKLIADIEEEEAKNRRNEVISITRGEWNDLLGLLKTVTTVPENWNK